MHPTTTAPYTPSHGWTQHPQSGQDDYNGMPLSHSTEEPYPTPSYAQGCEYDHVDHPIEFFNDSFPLLGQASNSSDTNGPSVSQHNQQETRPKSATSGLHEFRRAELGYMEIRRMQNANFDDEFYIDWRYTPPRREAISASQQEDRPQSRSIPLIIHHHSVPSDQTVFHNIDLVKHNPDNYSAYMEQLKQRRLSKKYDRVKFEKRHQDLVQSARALGWMSMGPERPEDVNSKSPAVHAVYASGIDKRDPFVYQDLVLWSRKEQKWRKQNIRRQQVESDRKRPRRRGLKWKKYDAYQSHHSDIHDLDIEHQIKHDGEERRQREKYYDDFKLGKLPRLHLDRKTGFRLTKSREKQWLTRLFSKTHIREAPDEITREQMRVENRSKRKAGICKVMDEDDSSSDDEYQPPRESSIPPQYYEP